MVCLNLLNFLFLLGVRSGLSTAIFAFAFGRAKFNSMLTTISVGIQRFSMLKFSLFLLAKTKSQQKD